MRSLAAVFSVLVLVVVVVVECKMSFDGKKCPSKHKDSASLAEDGNTFYFSGDLKKAGDCYQAAISASGDNVMAINNLGLVHMASKDVKTALSFFKKALRKNPKYASAYYSLGSALYSLQDYPKAETNLKAAIKINPTFSDAYNNLGNVYTNVNRLSQAEEAYRAAVRYAPQSAERHANLARILCVGEKKSEGFKEFDIALQLDPTNPVIYNELGRAQDTNQLYAEAVRSFTHAATLSPTADSYYRLGDALQNLHRPQPALDAFRMATKLSPSHAEAWMSIGVLFWQQGMLKDAITALRTSVSHRPLAEAYANLGIVLADAGLPEEAREAYKETLKINPNLAEGYKTLADLHVSLNEYDEGIAMYRKALEKKPNYREALNDLVHALQTVCDWDSLATHFALLEKMLAADLRDGQLPLFVKPFHALVYPLQTQHMLLVAKAYAHRAIRIVENLLPAPLRMPKAPKPGKKLRVGYVSSNLGDHSMSHLMQNVFGMHGSDIEVFAFALNPVARESDIPFRQRISDSLSPDHFVELAALSGVKMAQTINQRGVHVLIDLVGYTGGGERANEIFALKPSPQQISYMGFCASTGAPYMHGLVTDRVASPPDFQSLYSEKLIYVPNSYFVTDHRQSAPQTQNPPSRESLSLPSTGVLLACFNQLYKMDAPLFDVWAAVLKANPTASLWLLKFPPVAERRIRKEAKRRSLDSKQLVFTHTVRKHEYLDRARVADLFLDTPLVNAHTSATDVLWAGVPMVSTPRESMASRVAASLLRAAGLDSLIVPTLSDYQRLVSLIAGSPTTLKALKAAVAAAKQASPVFDTRLWVRNLDRAVKLQWDVFVSGAAAHHVVVRA